MESFLKSMWFRVPWFAMTIMLVIWSVLSGLQFAVNLSLISENTKLALKDSDALSIEKVEGDYIVLQNKEKVKSSEIDEYVFTMPGTFPRYLGEGTATKPLSVMGIFRYGYQFFGLAVGSYMCMAVCNYLLRVLKRWKRVTLRMFYSVLFIGYAVPVVLLGSAFTYVSGIEVYYGVAVVFAVLFVVYDICLFSIRLEDKDVGKE